MGCSDGMGGNPRRREPARRRDAAGRRLRVPGDGATPFDKKAEAELDWYFEEHLRFPITAQVRARDAGASVTAYGEALFRQLIGSDEARETYGKLKEDRAYPDKLALAVIGTPAFQALHWVLLNIPKLRHGPSPSTPRLCGVGWRWDRRWKRGRRSCRLQARLQGLDCVAGGLSTGAPGRAPEPGREERR